MLRARPWSSVADVVGALWLSGSNDVRLNASILSHNTAPQLVHNPNSTSPVPPCPLLSSAFYPAATGDALCTPEALDPSVMSVEPGFLAYDDEGLPTDWHLALDSPLIDVLLDDPDPDGSPGDLGIFGGSGGDGWDLDGDGIPTYFWPGAFGDAPDGVDPARYEDGGLWPAP